MESSCVGTDISITPANCNRQNCKWNDHQLKKLSIVKQILLVSTLGNVETVWRIRILMLGYKGLSVIFLMMCTFSYGHLILVSFTSWHLRRIKSTLVIWHIVGKLIKFYLIKNMKGHFSIGFLEKLDQGSPDHHFTRSRSKITGSKIKDQGSRIKDQGSRIKDQGSVQNESNKLNKLIGMIDCSSTWLSQDLPYAKAKIRENTKYWKSHTTSWKCQFSPTDY